MSFILDALKKSETERQQQQGGEFSSVPSRTEGGPSLRWLWILAILLGVNIAVLLFVLLRPAEVEPAATIPAPQAGQPAAERPAEPPAEPSFAEQVALAREAQSLREADAGAAEEPAPDATPVAAMPTPRPAASTARIRTIDEVRLNGTLQIQDLHLDLHVYDPDPARRFVFVNMEKYRENDQLGAGPVVREITPDGVVLNYQGTTFLLPRE